MFTSVLANVTREEEDEDHCGRDPEWTVQVWITVEDVEKRSSREEGRCAPVQNIVCINVEEL